VKKLFKYAFFLLLLAGMINCKKNTFKTGNVPSMSADVQPESDLLNSTFSDTATFYIHTVGYDSSRSYQDQFKYLGSNQDPVFGRTNASIFTNFSMPNGITNVSFGDDAVLDSAELILTFTQSFVGDTTTPLLYEIHQLTQSLDRTKAYYMHSTVPYSSTKLSSSTRRISKTGSFYSIRLPLDQTFASAVITNPAYLVNNTTFQSIYKGFYITTKNTFLTPSQMGALMKIDLDNAVSGVYMYYHNGGPSSSKEPKTFRFPFSGDNPARFNNIVYDPNSGGNSMLIDQLDETDTTKGKQDFFLKGVAGSKAVIRLPYLKNYSGSEPIAVNRAELKFKVDQSFVSSTGKYEPPLQLSLVAIDGSGKETYVKDQYYSSDLQHFGGSYDPVNKQYVFNIARHVQDIMSGKLENYGFYLVVANPDKSYVARRDDKAERVVLGGTNNSMYKPSFSLTYIRFPYDK
jgi:hypothetical protein